MPPPHSQAVFLVDGYNVIGAWPSLQKARNRHGLEAARDKLIEALVNYSACEGLETQIIFDAQYQATSGNCEAITSHLSVHFTEFGQTADTYIEIFCASFRRKLSLPPRRLIVATSDRAQRLTVVGYGAEWMSAQQLVYDVELKARRLLSQHRSPKQSPSRFLVNSLDAKAQQRLAELRKGLK